MAWLRWRAERDGRRLATLQWRDESGVHSKALKTPSEAVAQTYLRAFERSLGKRGPVRALKSTQDALDAYLGEKGLGARPATVQMCRANLEPLFTAWAEVPMHQWSKTIFVRYIAEKKAWSPRAVQMFVGDCRRFIRWAAADGSGVACPDFVGEFKCPAVHQKEPHHLEPEQLALLLADVHGTPLEVPVALAALAGLRRAEFFGLDAKAIDWEKQVLHVTSTKTHRDARVEISPALLEVLMRHRVASGPVVRLGDNTRNTYRSLHAACRRIHTRLRVATYLADPAAGRPGKRPAQRRAHAEWEAGERAFPRIGWHTLRHSFATALLAKGVDLRTVQDLMRHKTAAMTMRYAHSTSERRRAAVEKVLA
jgi:integrase